ncbi:MAG: DUF362 domain-containing protein [Bacteroidales bacterium]|nr:DUF362 domain-containing protein [Bacteroidales bacterium]
MSNSRKIDLMPDWLKKMNRFLKQGRFPVKLIFIVISVLSTIWFLIRVIPKPSRATYPCMQVAFPFMSGFIIWIISLSGSFIAFRKARLHFLQARYMAAFILLLTGTLSLYIFLTKNATPVIANVEPWYQPNDPVGVARGIFPGRVAWAHAPGAANWDGKTGYWWEDHYNNQVKIDMLFDEALLSLTDEKTVTDAWNALFVSFNQKIKEKQTGYTVNETIAIKINQNNTYSHENTNEINTTPQLVLSVLKSLINDANINQQHIIVFDNSRFITDNIFSKCHGSFPDVLYIDNSGGNGRIKAQYAQEALPYSKDNGRLARGLAKCMIDADYIINMAVLKGHVGQGVTLCAKNYYGATNIHADWRKNVHNNFDQERDGSPRYMTFVDFMGHKNMGEKTMLFLIDAIYASKFVDGVPSFKMQMSPFNNSWPSSLFLSQDGVAIDAVGMDFIINEWPDAPDLKYCDHYLREAAMLPDPPSGTFYDPEKDGTGLQSLGVLEHWNNPNDKQYSRNLGKEKGIELIYKILD